MKVRSVSCNDLKAIAKVIQKDRHQLEFTLTVSQYIEIRSAIRSVVEKGRKLLHQHRKVLVQVEDQIRRSTGKNSYSSGALKQTSVARGQISP